MQQVGDQTSTSVTSLLFSLLSDLSASVQEIIKSLALRALSQLPPIAIPSGSKKTIIHHLPVAKERTTRSSGKGRHQSPMVVPVEEEEDVLPGGGGEEKDEKEDEEDEDCVPSTWDIPLSVKTFMQDDRATDPHNEYDIENIADDYVENITSYFDTILYAIIEICTFKFFSEEALVFLKKHNATKLANVYVQALVIIRDKRKKNSPANVLALANIRRKLWGTLRTKMRQSLGRYIRTLEAANFFMSHSAKVLCAMCQKKHVGCIHHPLEKRKSRWPNTASGTSRRPTFLTPSSLLTYTKKIFVEKFDNKCVRVCL